MTSLLLVRIGCRRVAQDVDEEGEPTSPPVGDAVVSNCSSTPEEEDETDE